MDARILAVLFFIGWLGTGAFFVVYARGMAVHYKKTEADLVKKVNEYREKWEKARIELRVHNLADPNMKELEY